MDKNVIDNIYDSDLNNELEVNTMKDIINSIGFKSEEDKLMCEVIITNLEKYAAENIKQSKTVNIPYIGCIRKSPLREAIVSHRFDFKKARLSMSKEEYKDYVRQSIDKLKKEERRKNNLKRELYKIQKINHKQYNKLYESVGKTYADFYIFAIYCLTPVEHNEEFEELYRELSNNEQ